MRQVVKKYLPTCKLDHDNQKQYLPTENDLQDGAVQENDPLNEGVPEQQKSSAVFGLTNLHWEWRPQQKGFKIAVEQTSKRCRFWDKIQPKEPMIP